MQTLQHQMALALVLVAACLLAETTADSIVLESGTLRLAVNTRSGTYNVSVDGDQWFASGDAYFSDGGHTFSALAGNISVVSSNEEQGSDAAGAYKRLSLEWARTGSSTAEWRTAFSAYEGRSALTFAQTFLKAMGGDPASGSRFPSLRATGAAAASGALGTLEYSGSSCGFMVSARGSYPGIAGGHGRGMIAIVPNVDAPRLTGSALAIGPVREMFVNQASQAEDNAIGYGVGSSFAELPQQFTVETLLVASSSAATFSSPRATAPERASIPAGGANGALAEYGDFVLARHSKARPLGNHTQEASHLGYSTTGYYFYNLCDCSDEMENTHKRTTCSAQGSAIPGCSSYQDTLEAVHDALVAQRVPYKHMLLDSWWYGENIYGGASLWEDAAFVRNISFPRGLRAFWQRIGTDKTIWAHNGKWSKTPYAQNYSFTPDASLPQGDSLWQHLFSANHQGWGLGTIKQDHMGENIGACKTSYSNVSVLNSWLGGMAQAATDNGVGVLYCCAPPSVHMFGATVQAAYAVRASPDYVWQANGRVLKLPQVQWALGPDNAFHYLANGLLPYKDTFFSNTTMAQTRPAGTDKSQWPPFYEYYESDPSTHALMALLSMGPVTFSDAVGATNRTLVMQTCRQDGVLLKPDRPATALDAQFNAMLFGQWPGEPPAPTPGHGTLAAAPCVPGDASQAWSYDPHTGTLSLADDAHSDGRPNGCINIASCSTDDGADVRLYNNSAGCGAGPGTCKDQNELWNITAGSIVSRWNNKCLAADERGARVLSCDSSDASQRWVYSPGGGTITAAAQGNGDMCLTGGRLAPLVAVADAGVARPQLPQLDALSALDDAAALAEATAGLSASYSNSTRVSAIFMASLARRSLRQHRAACRSGTTQKRKTLVRRAGSDEECDMDRLAAPQGPLGEAYSTHSTVGSETWFYAIGVQIARDLELRPGHLVASAAAKNRTYVRVAWQDPAGFRPVARADILPFDDANPIVLSANPKSAVGHRPGSLYAAQLHVIAPVLQNGWAVVGEAAKFLPISSQRLVDVDDSSATGIEVTVVGSPGESVAFTFVHVADVSADPVTVECKIQASGRAIIAYGPAARCS
eukprot:g1500.t1